MADFKCNKMLDCRKGAWYSLNPCQVLWKKFSTNVLLGKLSFSLGSFVSFCRVFSVRIVLVSGLVRLYGSLENGKPN